MRIYVLGSVNIDRVYRVRRIVAPGETVNASSFELFSGGKGYNQTTALARAGANAHDHVAPLSERDALRQLARDWPRAGNVHTRPGEALCRHALDPLRLQYGHPLPLCPEIHGEHAV